MRRAPLAAPALALLASTGCLAYRLAPVPAPRGAVVRVSFETPRTLDVAVRDGDSIRTTRVDGVTRVEGRVLATRGDTLDLLVTAVRTGRERVTGMPAVSRAVVVQEPGRPAEQLRVAKGRTALALAAVAAAGAAAFFTWLHIVMSDPDY